MKRASIGVIAAGVLVAGFTAAAKPPETLALRSLTVEQARQLIGRHEYLLLDGLSSLTPEVARVLAMHDGESLSLDGLTTMPPEVARELAACQSLELDLNGLQKLTPDAARALARFSGVLFLDGLTALPTEVAKPLMAQRGWLSLGGLTTVSPDLALLLVTHAGSHVSLGGIKAISAPALATLRADPEIGLPEALAAPAAPKAR